MPRDPHRPDRVGEAIREEVAAFLAGGVKDPRVVGLVTVTAVEMSRDLGTANVFVSIVGRALKLRIAPHINFRVDDSVARAAKIETLLASLRPKPDALGDAGAGTSDDGN